MHDPMTVAFTIPNPLSWRRDYRRRLRPNPLITVWHKDPERGGDDDSCDWFGTKRKLRPDEQAIINAMWDVETLLDNPPHYPDSREHKAWSRLRAAIRKWRHRRPRIRWHPRWHFWHWRLQIHPLQHLRRMFSRCSRCGKRFGYGEAAVSASWSGKGPMWHTRCDAVEEATRTLDA